MKVLPEKHFDNVFWFVSAMVLAIVALRSYLIPFSHDEVATFLYYIQPGDFIPFYAHPDANGHFLTSATSWVTYKLFGSDPWALRLPTTGAFALLSYSVFKVNKLFRGIYAKIFFSASFILSFNFIGYYSLCRGYGFSMAFLILTMYYFFVHIRYGSFRHFTKFILFSQFALSANLTLVIVVLLLTGCVIFFQIRNKLFFQTKVIVTLLLHFAFLLFWIKFAFFLQQGGALYYGGGESYWKVTFETLIATLFFNNIYFNILVIVLYLLMTAYWIGRLVKERADFIYKSNFSLAFMVLTGTILAFYLLKLVVHVNYPEDRTGLFFYVFFILALALLINALKPKWQPLFLIIPFLFIWQFVDLLNFRVHPWRVYETIPANFFEILTTEQKSSDRPITVAGHRVREFIYGFQNYNSKVKLSHMTAPEALQMNGDYAIAYKQDKPYYDPYYVDIASDLDWDFRLLKRRTPIRRNAIYDDGQVHAFVGSYEYYNAFEKLDTIFQSESPLLAQFTLSFKKVPVPFDAWLVLQISGDKEEEDTFVRTPLNLIKYDWNGTSHFTTCLLTGRMPLHVKRIVAYLWNIQQAEIEFQIESFKLFRLEGKGINVISKANI